MNEENKKQSAKQDIGDFFVSSEEYFIGHINTENKETAESVLKTLLEEDLINMGIIFRGLSAFRKDERINKKLYYSLTVYTVGSNKNKIISTIENMPYPNIPMVTFSRIEQANVAFMEQVFETKAALS